MTQLKKKKKITQTVINTFCNHRSIETKGKTQQWFIPSNRQRDNSVCLHGLRFTSCQIFLSCFFLITFQMSKQKRKARPTTHSLNNKKKHKPSTQGFKASWRVVPWSFFCLLPSSNSWSSMGIVGSILARDTSVDSHNMLRELKLSNFLPCWSKAARSKMGLR